MAGFSLQTWALSVLHGLGIKPTPQNMQAMTGWARAEGGHFANDAKFNPLNTTQPMPGAGNTGSQGNIKVYRSPQQGIEATVKTLQNGNYGPILAALKQGKSAAAVAQAIGQTPWGTSGDLVMRTIAGTPAGSVHGSTLDLSSSNDASYAHNAGGSSGTTLDTPKQPSVFDTIRQLNDAQKQRDAQDPYTPSSQMDDWDPAKGIQETVAKLQAITGQNATAASTGTGPGDPSTPATGPTDGSKIGNFEGAKVASWMIPALRFARQQGWAGHVTSGVRTLAEQQALYNNRANNPNPVAKPGSSNHEIENGGAVDVSDPTGLARFMKKYKGRRLVEGLAINDPVHFSATGR